MLGLWVVHLFVRLLMFELGFSGVGVGVVVPIFGDLAADFGVFRCMLTRELWF